MYLNIRNSYKAVSRLLSKQNYRFTTHNLRLVYSDKRNDLKYYYTICQTTIIFDYHNILIKTLKVQTQQQKRAFFVIFVQSTLKIKEMEF